MVLPYWNHIHTVADRGKHKPQLPDPVVRAELNKETETEA